MEALKPSALMNKPNPKYAHVKSKLAAHVRRSASVEKGKDKAKQMSTPVKTPVKTPARGTRGAHCIATPGRSRTPVRDTEHSTPTTRRVKRKPAVPKALGRRTTPQRQRKNEEQSGTPAAPAPAPAPEPEPTPAAVASSPAGAADEDYTPRPSRAYTAVPVPDADLAEIAEPEQQCVRMCLEYVGRTRYPNPLAGGRRPGQLLLRDERPCAPRRDDELSMVVSEDTEFVPQTPFIVSPLTPASRSPAPRSFLTPKKSTSRHPVTPRSAVTPKTVTPKPRAQRVEAVYPAALEEPEEVKTPKSFPITGTAQTVVTPCADSVSRREEADPIPVVQEPEEVKTPKRTPKPQDAQPVPGTPRAVPPKVEEAADPSRVEEPAEEHPEAEEVETPKKQQDPALPPGEDDVSCQVEAEEPRAVEVVETPQDTTTAQSAISATLAPVGDVTESQTSNMKSNSRKRDENEEEDAEPPAKKGRSCVEKRHREEDEGASESYEDDVDFEEEKPAKKIRLEATLVNEMSYRQMQHECKIHGLKANGKARTLRTRLLAICDESTSSLTPGTVEE